MNLYFRLCLALWQGRRTWKQFGKRPLDIVSSNTFRVWPHDLDAFGHMNNGRYLQIMDVARAQWMASTGVIGAMREQHWGAVLGGNITRYRRALKLWQVYTVHTHLVCWDDDWFVFEHNFMDKRGRCAAVGLSRAALRSTKGWVPAPEAVEFIAPGTSSDPFPDHVRHWLGLEEDMYRYAGEKGAGGQRAVAVENYS